MGGGAIELFASSTLTGSSSLPLVSSTVSERNRLAGVVFDTSVDFRLLADLAGGDIAILMMEVPPEGYGG